MVYELSDNNVLYSASNQFLYVNKNLLQFLNINLGKMEQKNAKNERMSRLYKWLSIEGGLNLLHTMLWTVVFLTRFDKYNISS